MLIILEGCDCSGKTTLAKKLQFITGAKIIHCTTDTPNDFWFFSNIIQMSETHDIITDRFCYGQFVYQNPEERKLTSEELCSLELNLINRDAKLVYVRANPEDIEKRLEERNEELFTSPKEVQDRFEKIFDKSLVDVKVYDTSNRNTCCKTWEEYKNDRF